MKSHRIDLVSAFFGIVFLGLGVAILAGHGDVTLRYMTVLGPVLLVAFGLVLVAAAIRRQRPQPQPVEQSRPSYSYAGSYAGYTAPLGHPSAEPDDEQQMEQAADGKEVAPYDAGDEA